MSRSKQGFFRKEWEERGVEVREANYHDEEQMNRAFSGADCLPFISSIINDPKRVEQHRKVIESCKKAGKEYITYIFLVVLTVKDITRLQKSQGFHLNVEQ